MSPLSKGERRETPRGILSPNNKGWIPSLRACASRRGNLVLFVIVILRSETTKNLEKGILHFVQNDGGEGIAAVALLLRNDGGGMCPRGRSVASFFVCPCERSVAISALSF